MERDSHRKLGIKIFALFAVVALFDLAVPRQAGGLTALLQHTAAASGSEQPPGRQGPPSDKEVKPAPSRPEPPENLKEKQPPGGEMMGKATDDQTWDDLAKKAQKDGEVGVIVALKASARPEGDLDEGTKKEQRERVKTKRNEVLKELEGTKVKDVSAWDEVPFTAMRVGPQALNVLRRSSRVVGIEEDRPITLDLEPQKEETSGGESAATTSNSNLADWWDFYKINADDLWGSGYTGYGQSVAIVDTGVQSNHTLLSGKVAREYCRTYYAACPNGSYEQVGSGAARPCTFHWKCAHGTHVAGTAAGQYGVAKGASLLAIQVFYRGSDGQPTYHPSSLSWAMQYVYNQRSSLKIAAINFSLSDSSYKYTSPCGGTNFEAWTKTLNSVGIAVVVASGNNNYSDGLTSPACSPSAISVGNSTMTCSTPPCTDTSGTDAVYGGVAGGSNAAPYLSVLAPGTHICNSVPNATFECWWGGTSMAAPHVAGAIAALRHLEPWSPPVASLTALQQTGAWVLDSRGNNLWKKRIDVWQALGYAATH